MLRTVAKWRFSWKMLPLLSFYSSWITHLIKISGHFTREEILFAFIGQNVKICEERKARRYGHNPRILWKYFYRNHRTSERVNTKKNLEEKNSLEIPLKQLWMFIWLHEEMKLLNFRLNLHIDESAFEVFKVALNLNWIFI